MFAGIIISGLLRFFRRRAGTEPKAAPAVAAGRKVMVGTALAQIAFVLVLVTLGANIESLFMGAPTSLKVGLALPLVGLLLAVAGAWFAVVQWRSGQGSLWARLRHSGAVLVALAFFWSLNTWNLLGWRM